MIRAKILNTLAGLAAIAALTHQAHAARFSVVANLGGLVQIGAIKGQDLYGTLPNAIPPVFFRLTKSGTYTMLHAFATATDGGAPNARLAADQFGDIFGTSNTGGTNGSGTLWEYSSHGSFTTPHIFGGTGDGTGPLQGPTIGPDNAIFGTTSMGAPNNNGILYKMTETGGYSTLYNFLSGSDGHCPFSGVAIRGGAIYGSTVGAGYGGNPNGSVWKYTTAGGMKTLYVFQDGADGEWPDQAPVVDKNGNIYGTTHQQNSNSFAGAIWTISAAGKFSVLHDLKGATDGYYPNSPLVLDKNGKLYGTTYEGGAGGVGTVFQITPAGKFAVVHSFTNGADGGNPTGNLVFGAQGALYGGTGSGQVFRLSP